VTGGDWAWIIAAGFWGLLVVVLCIVLLNVFRLISQVGDLVEGVTDETVPLIGGVGETVSGVNVQLARVDDVLSGVQHMTHTADQMVTVIHATVSNPLIKVVAFAVGTTKAVKRLANEDG
jgi:methyl-accepting chemotaxis protein